MPPLAPHTSSEPLVVRYPRPTHGERSPNVADQADGDSSALGPAEATVVGRPARGLNLAQRQMRVGGV
jgi:hypothetical protein